MKGNVLSPQMETKRKAAAKLGKDCDNCELSKADTNGQEKIEPEFVNVYEAQETRFRQATQGAQESIPQRL